MSEAPARNSRLNADNHPYRLDLNIAQSLQIEGQLLQLLGEYDGAAGHGLVSLGLSLQNLGQSVDNLVQLLKTCP